METEEQLKRLPYWDKLTDSEKELVRQNTLLRKCNKGEFLKGPRKLCLETITIVDREGLQNKL